MKRCLLVSVALGCTAPKDEQDVLKLAPVTAPAGPTCAGDPRCGADEASCCESSWLRRGIYSMGFSRDEVPRPEDLAEEDRDHEVMVGDFFLDRFEITRGRYAEYRARFSGPPAPGAGAHPALPGSGWQEEWDDDLAAAFTQGAAEAGDAGAEAGSAALPTPASEVTFAAEPLSWFAAFAFCIWDGGRLPTEAEWEYAATGADFNFAYPWGNDPGPVQALRDAPAEPVGSHPELRGRFGHDDLAGGVLEWTLDWFADDYYTRRGAQCVDCANLEERIARVVRGEADPTCCAGDLDTQYRAAARSSRAPGVLASGVGARCARDLPSAD